MSWVRLHATEQIVPPRPQRVPLTSSTMWLVFSRIVHCGSPGGAFV